MATFNFSYAPGTSLQQMVGFETAGRIWSSYLTDNVTVNLHVGVSSSLPSNVIGGALPGIKAAHSFLDIKTRLTADATSADDQTAMGNINRRWGNQQDFKASFDLFNGLGINARTSATTQTFNLTRANAKALGVSLLGGNIALDGVIMFGSLAGSAYSWNYDYTRTSIAPANSLDFLSTAIHEIGHTLGIVSGIDKPGWVTSTVGFNKILETTYKSFVTTSATYTTPLDLFRYSSKTLGTLFCADANDLSYGSKGGEKYFSIDGNNIIAQFATGKDTSLGGDGEQASHWKSGTFGIMDPTLAPTVRESITALDLRAMDVIGWNLAANATTLNLDLSALAGQSQTALATRLGQTVTWMNANATTAAANITEDHSTDIAAMLVSSQIYNWGTTLLNPYRQVVNMMSRQEVYSSFQTTTSMCSCSVCQPSAKAGLAAAISSTAPKTTGWIGSEPSEGQRGLSNHDLQVKHRLSQVMQAIVPSGVDLGRLTRTSEPSAPVKVDALAFSGSQLVSPEPQASAFPVGQREGSPARRCDEASGGRRSGESWGRSGNFDAFAPAFDALGVFTMS